MMAYITLGVDCFILQRLFAETVKSATDFPFGTIRLVHVLTSFSRHIYQRSVVTFFRGIKEMAALLLIPLWKW
jgi:hypothetical protein